VVSAIFRRSLVLFGEITIGTHLPQKALKDEAPSRILVEKEGRPAASAIVVRHPHAKYFVVDKSVGRQCVRIKYAKRKGRTYMSSKLFVPAAVFVLGLVCAVGAVAQARPTCDSLLNSKSAVQANANSADAYVQFCLGLAYEAGHVVPRDYSQAMTWYRKAAEQGEKYAQYNLGSMYNNGEGVTQDYAQAATWFRKSAEQGLSQAQFILGRMYYNGTGIPQDYAQALIWFQKAAEQGDAVSQLNLGIMYGDGQGGPQDYAQAMSWFRKAAEQGSSDAKLNLGLMYHKGQGVPQDYAQATAWYQKAAEEGNYKAQCNLGFMYNNGLGVTQNYAEAYYWFAIAASAGKESAEQKQIIKLRDDAASHLTPATLSREQKRVSERLEAEDD
jgi:uncharacterized protein